MEDKTGGIAGVTTKQKIIGVVVLVVIGVLVWQVIGMFGSSGEEAKQAAVVPKPSNPINDQKPQIAKLPETPIQPVVQNELTQIEQQSEARYVQAVNELQMLKVTQQIVDTTKQIAEAKTATVKAQKEIVDLLTPKALPKELDNSVITTGPNANNGKGQNPILIAPNNNEINQAVSPLGSIPMSGDQGPANNSNPNQKPEVKVEFANYNAISVTELMNRWQAVLSYRGKLYSVFIGDVLPEDGSTVININKYSVTLEKSGVQKRISLVPII